MEASGSYCSLFSVKYVCVWVGRHVESEEWSGCISVTKGQRVKCQRTLTVDPHFNKTSTFDEKLFIPAIISLKGAARDRCSQKKSKHSEGLAFVMSSSRSSTLPLSSPRVS